MASRVARPGPWTAAWTVSVPKKLKAWTADRQQNKLGRWPRTVAMCGPSAVDRLTPQIWPSTVQILGNKKYPKTIFWARSDILFAHFPNIFVLYFSLRCMVASITFSYRKIILSCRILGHFFKLSYSIVKSSKCKISFRIWLTKVMRFFSRHSFIFYFQFL